MASKELEAALDALFAAPPEEFLSTRDALAKQLKAAGDKEGSAQLKARHKPTLTARALNQLARDAAPELAALLQASQALASGKDFKAALERQRAALDAVAKKATGPDVPAVMAVVRGAQVDPSVAEQVRLGRFSKLPEVQVGFFGAVPDAPPAPAPVVSPKADEAAATHDAALARARAEEEAAARRRDELEAARREAGALAAAAEQAEKDAADARRRAQAAADRVVKLEKQR